MDNEMFISENWGVIVNEFLSHVVDIAHVHPENIKQVGDSTVFRIMFSGKKVSEGNANFCDWDFSNFVQTMEFIDGDITKPDDKIHDRDCRIQKMKDDPNNELCHLCVMIEAMREYGGYSAEIKRKVDEVFGKTDMEITINGNLVE